jgi:hypothetical protein
MHAVVGAMMPRIKMFEGVQEGQPTMRLDVDGLTADLVLIPDKPDETLR